MGRFEARIVEADFEIPAALVPSALADLTAFLRELGYDLPVADLRSGFGLFELIAESGPDGSVTGVTFDALLLAELEELFRIVAPYVVPGCFLVWRSGSGEQWRYDFDGERLRTAPA